MTEVLIIVLYLSFVFDFLIWPIPSEVSTASLVSGEDRKSRSKHYPLLLAYIIVLALWTAPLLHSITGLFDESSKPAFVQSVGLLLAAAGRALTMTASFTLQRHGIETLCTHSVFALSRHPIVTGLHITLAGLLLVLNVSWLWIPYLFSLIYFDRKIVIEEQNLDAVFGKTYTHYAQSTPRYLVW